MTVSQVIARVLTPEHLRVFNDWRRQPSTVAGFMALGGTLASLTAGTISWRQALGGFVIAGVGLVFPDNANRKTSEVPAAVAASPPVSK